MRAQPQADTVAGTARAAAGSGAPHRRPLRAGDRAAGGVCVLSLILMAALLLGIVSGYRPLVDHSDSMAPAIRAGDLLITHAKPAGSVRRGEIVSFEDPALAGRLVTHRVVSIHPAGSRLDFITKGDANAATESWSTARGASIGVLVFRVPEVGRTIAWVDDPVVRTAILTLAALLLSTALLRRVWRAGP
jgi:signal peptidase I